MQVARQEDWVELPVLGQFLAHQVEYIHLQVAEIKGIVETGCVVCQQPGRCQRHRNSGGSRPGGDFA